jgi:hypothetical protein
MNTNYFYIQNKNHKFEIMLHCKKLNECQVWGEGSSQTLLGWCSGHALPKKSFGKHATSLSHVHTFDQPFFL